MWENSKLHGNLNNHKTVPPGAPLPYFNDGGGEEISNFFWSEILAKSDFLGLWKTPGFFGVSKKKEWDFLGVV